MVPAEHELWQDPVPAVTHELIGEQEIPALKTKILASGLSISQLVTTAWAIGGFTFRGTDKGAVVPNGAHVFAWRRRSIGTSTSLVELLKILRDLGGHPKGVQQIAVQRETGLTCRSDRSGWMRSRRGSGKERRTPCEGTLFAPGRTDASQEETDIHSFAVLEPTADGFRNYLENGHQKSAEEQLVDRARMLTLTAPEMTVLIGCMRALDANFGQSKHGVLTNQPGTLTNDFFVNLLDMNTEWKAASEEVFSRGAIEQTGEIKWTGTRVDLVFGSSSELRAIAEIVYACGRALGEGEVRK